MEYCIKCLNNLSDDCAFRELIGNKQVVLKNGRCPMYLGITSIPKGVELEYQDSDGNVSRICTIEGG